MTDTLLQALRDNLLDESEPLAGLLRKCLLLGAETGSDQLRAWARHELSGYADGDDLPDYRKFDAPPISIDSQNGNTWIKGQIIDRLQMPLKVREFVPAGFHFHQPVEELEQLAKQKSLSFTSPGLAMAASTWNRELDMFQNIIGMHYVMSSSAVAGIIGQIRTRLVEFVADLTAGTPISELPSKGRVDQVVAERLVGNVYNTTVHNVSGAVAVGDESKSKSVTGVSTKEALRLLELVSDAGRDLEEDLRVELSDAVEELRAAMSVTKPKTGEIVKKAGKLRSLGEKIGVATVSASIASATSVLTELALAGAFG